MNVERGDYLYLRGDDGPTVGKVLCHGKHGVTVDCVGGQQRVKWEDVLGRKESVTTRARVVDEGIDGAILEHEDGRRAYVHGLKMPRSEDVKKEPGVWEKLEMAKAMVLFLKAGPIKNRVGLHLEQVVDRAGHQVKRWKRGERPAKVGRDKKDPEEERGSKHGYGTGNIQEGDVVRFETPDDSGQGQIVALGDDGVTVKDREGREIQVRWDEIRHRRPGGGSAGAKKTQHEAHPVAIGSQEAIPSAQFKAADYAKQHDQKDVTPELILERFPDDTRQKIAAAQQRLKSVEQTIDQHQKNGEWVEDRRRLHAEIVREMLSPERIKAATPAKGEQPTFVILGGRGGSGKSSFEGAVYDPTKAVVLDADHIKGMLPEYEGWNAHQVHEESGEIFDNLVRTARTLGLNVVLDKTMKTAKSAINDVKAFKAAGYRTEAHYMHLPRQESAKRAVARFLNGGDKGRYVPVEVILSNTGNEASFDEVKGMVDAWSFRDNNVPRGQESILISHSGDELNKSLCKPIIFLWRNA